MARVGDMIMVVLIFLTLTQCTVNKPEAPQWTTQFVLPLVSRTYEMPEIIDKMVEGRMRKFYEESVLLSQTFVIDGENTVEKALKNAESGVGAPITLKAFERLALGEGVEKEEEDFAAEVAAQIKDSEG